MSFATDYCTAYKTLRTGVELSSLERRSGMDSGMEYVLSRIRANALRPVNRFKAAFYALSVAREMRRQRILVHGLFNMKDDTPTQVVNQRPIHLFPITVNKTTVKMIDKDDA